MKNPMPPDGILDILREGTVIPAHPLALTGERRLDESRQRALTRYYCHAGAGGVAVGVHTTQFAIREPKIGLFHPVLDLARETVAECSQKLKRPIIMIGGICGKTEQAVKEAALLRELGYHAGLLSLGALAQADVDTLIAHCQEVAKILPLVGFYLQPAVGGRVLPSTFWRLFAEIENVVAVKIAPFNRYQTLDVVRGVAEADRTGDVALYTGNDDNIVMDLLTPYCIPVEGGHVEVRIVGGLLGHWACWTQKAVELLTECHRIVQSGGQVSSNMLALSVEVTDSNAAFFDVANGFRGCIAGIHEILRRQGLLAGRWCLDPDEELSPGQMEEIDRVCKVYPHLSDDDFVAQHLDEWLR